jgi:hypothetical protein
MERPVCLETRFKLAPRPRGLQAQSLYPDLSPNAFPGTAIGAFWSDRIDQRPPRSYSHRLTALYSSLTEIDPMQCGRTSQSAR